jgi:ABC-type molybdenum transport system ATPase subunit/photorepair protein PhrA
MTAIAIQNKEEILKRVAKGDKISDIGKTYGVSHAAISKQLLKDPEWIEARMSGALARIEHWEKEVEKIDPDTNQVMLGQAKEMLSHARWRAEREFPSQRGRSKD